MKVWYPLALEELVSYLTMNKKINGLEFLEDFVLNHRHVYFESLEFDQVDEFVTDEFEMFQKWIIKTETENVNVGKNGKWYLNSLSKKTTPELNTGVQLDVNERQLLELGALGLDAGRVDDFKALYQKLAATNYHDLKYICASRLAKCAELSKDIHERELIEFWLNASDNALRATMLIEACECKTKVAYYFQRISNNAESALSYKEAYLLVEKLTYSEKIKLLRNARIQYQIIGDHDSANEMFMKEKDLESCNSKCSKKIALFLFKLTSNYGESPKKVIINCLLIMVLFTFIAFFMGVTVNKNQDVLSWSSFLNSAYYTVVTFTTLGYGDYSPKTHMAQFFASILALSGLIFSSLFMVTVVRKYSRS